MKNLIVFCGLAGSGKTTAAKYLVANHGFTRLSFAAPLRDMLRAIGVSDYHLTEGKEEPCPALMGRTARHCLQTLGTQWGRGHVDENIWTHIAGERIKAALAEGKRIVIDDCRFDNEAELLLSMGAIIVDLHKAGEVRRSDHASEAGISPAYTTCELLAADLDELFTKVEQLVT
jgi:hypothetical protein